MIVAHESWLSQMEFSFLGTKEKKKKKRKKKEKKEKKKNKNKTKIQDMLLNNLNPRTHLPWNLLHKH